MAEETTVGGIVGFLRMDADQAHREVMQLLAELQALKRADTTVHVDVDADRVAEALPRVRRDLDEAERSSENFGATNQRTAGRSRLLLDAIVMLGPALVPLGGVAVGLAGALGGMGAAGILAIMGIRREMEAGTTVGEVYRGGLGTLKAALQGLEATAARGVLGPFQQTVSMLGANMPAISAELETLGLVAGRTGQHLASGLVKALVDLGPLLTQGARYVEGLALRFDSLMQGGGAQRFGDYIRSVFPQVMGVVENLVGAAAHLIVALAPLGGQTLRAIGQLAEVLNSIPTPVLTALATGAITVYTGFRTWAALSSIVTAFSGALTAAGVAGATATRAMAGLSAAAGVVGVAFASVSIKAMAAEAQVGVPPVKDLAQALTDVANGAQKSSTLGDLFAQGMGPFRKVTEEASVSLERFGINAQANLNASWWDNAFGMAGERSAQFEKQVSQLDQALSDMVAKGNGTQAAAMVSQLQQAARDSGVSAEQASTMFPSYSAAIAASGAAAAVAAPPLGTLGTFTQLSGKAAEQADFAIKSFTDRLLALNNPALAARQATRDLAEALAAIDPSIKANGKTLDENTEKGRANNTAMDGVARAVLAHNQALKDSGAPQAQLRADLESGRASLAQTAVKFGMSETAAWAFVNQVLKIPPRTETDVKVETAEAEGKMTNAQRHLEAIDRAHPDPVISANPAPFHGVANNVDAKMAAMDRARADPVVLANDQTGAGIAAARRAMASVDGMRATTTIVTNFVSNYTSVTSGIRQAYGGIQSFADGGMRAAGTLPMRAMIAPDGANLVQWAERGTGDEAFIPLSPSRRSSSLPILEEVNRRMGNPLGGKQQGSAGVQGFAGPLEITGTLSSEWGPVQVQGMIQAAQDETVREVASRL